PLAPALERLDTVFRSDRLPIVPSKTVAQPERVRHAVRGSGELLDHLGLDLKALVRPEEGVVHEVAVIARDVRGGPDRIHDAEIALRCEPEAATALLRVNRGRAQGHRGCGDRGAPDDLAATDVRHAHAV